MTNKKHLNPYIFGPPVQDPNFFFGREYELSEIIDTIENVQPGLRQSMAIVGARRIGKTSILYQLKRRLKELPSPVALISTESIGESKSILLTQEILTELRESIRSKKLDTIDISFELLDESEPKEERVYQIFRRDLQKLNQALEENNNPPAVLMIDEVEGLQRFGGVNVLSFFRDLCQSLSYILFIVVGSEQLYQLVNDYTSPFFNVFKPITIHSLEDKDARALIEEPASRVGLDFSSDAVTRVLELSGRQPYLINMICHYAVADALQHQTSSITVNEVKSSQDKITSEDFFNSTIWKQIEDIEKVVLYILASRSEPRSREQIIFDFIDYVDVKLPTSKIPTILENLVQKQILRLNKDRNYFYNNQIFPEWISSRDAVSDDIRNILLKDFLAASESTYSSKQLFLESLLQQDTDSLNLVEEIKQASLNSERIIDYLAKLQNRIETTQIELRNLKEPKPPVDSSKHREETKTSAKPISPSPIDIIKFGDRFNDASAFIPRIARVVRHSLKETNNPPQTCSVEFGIGIEGKTGLLSITAKSSAVLNVKMTWKNIQH